MTALSRPLEDINQIDVSVFAAITETPTPSLDTFMRRLTNAANYSRLSIASAAVLAAAGGERGRRAAAYGLISIGVTSTTANLLIKPVARRPRPVREVRHARHIDLPQTTSFPSGHSAAAFAFATGVGQVMPQAGIPLRGLATLVAYSRVHTGVHFPSDTVVGALLGTVLAQLTVRTLERRRTRR